MNRLFDESIREHFAKLAHRLVGTAFKLLEIHVRRNAGAGRKRDTAGHVEFGEALLFARTGACRVGDREPDVLGIE